MEIKCIHINVNWFESGILYTCIIKSASITEPNQEIKALSGKHQPRKADRDVEAIWFDDTECHFMPRGIGKIFPNLKSVAIVTCGLKEISREDLVGLENIEKLDLRNNELTTLPDDLLEGMKKLKRIIFSYNKIEFVSSQLLQPVLVNQLTHVGFLNNPTINAAFEASEKNLSTVDLPRLMKLIDEKCKKPQKVGSQIKPMTSDKPALDDFNSNFMEGVKEFWTSGLFSDFTIIVGDKKFKVHKFALAHQSGFFKKMFVNQVEMVAELRNEDFSAETVEEVLRWIYTGQVPGNNPVEVFALAVKLEIYGLKLIAEYSVVKKLNQGNAMEMLELGHRCGSEKLIKAAFDEVKKILDEPDLDDDMMKKPEELKEIVEAKKNYETKLEKCKKRKFN